MNFKDLKEHIRHISFSTAIIVAIILCGFLIIKTVSIVLPGESYQTGVIIRKQVAQEYDNTLKNITLVRLNDGRIIKVDGFIGLVEDTVYVHRSNTGTWYVR